MEQQSWSEMGIRTSKVPSPLWNVNLCEYQQAVDWLRGELLAFGYEATTARFDPDRAMWYFYDATGRLQMRLSHETIDRTKRWLEAWYQKRLDADIRTLTQAPKREW